MAGDFFEDIQLLALLLRYDIGVAGQRVVGSGCSGYRKGCRGADGSNSARWGDRNHMVTVVENRDLHLVYEYQNELHKKAILLHSVAGHYHR